ncbi:uncharacterized protein LOC120722893 isoform X1 [Simochromis diagramma]|uniref:uncharacterized protein LOC120722893 isoform X1 n=1 Tax=Simochromis diagramma TaxID=43689 RepID=UPI001A7E1C45|nr:uncharacterized protein LOC120722893 isoform X1 [Simochromis diagramma]
MSPKKCIFGCEGKLNLFALPKEERIRQQWIQYLFSDQRPPKATVYVCSRHFSEDSFVNKAQYDAGFSARLLLKDGALPFIHGDVEESKAAASPVLLPLTRFRNTACQTDPEPKVSVATQFCHYMVSVGTQTSYSPSTRCAATQLSYNTLKQHVRSKATQASVLHCNVGTVTTQSETGIQPGVRPAKRPRLEMMEEEEGEEPEEEAELPEASDQYDPICEPYEPDESSSEPPDSREAEATPSHYNDPKYIVFESCLRDLFLTCPVCGLSCEVWRRRMGTFVSFSQLCPSCDYSRKWESQPVAGSTPLGNLQMSAAIYFTGGSFSHMEKVCRAMNLQVFQSDTFRRHARMFLEPAINHKWKRDQQVLMERLRGEGSVAVGGRMRADLLGHCGKLGSYTLMHLNSSSVIDIQLIQSAGVSGSSHVETEALRRGLDLLQVNRLSVDHIVTDRHARVQKYLRKRNVRHYYNIQHLEKGLSRKLKKLAKSKECLLVRRWLPSIRNHVYWSATTSTSAPEKVAKWKSLVNHIQNVHTHDDPLFPTCAHPNRVSMDPSKWFQPDSVALHKLKKLLLNKRILADVGKLSHDHQASTLERFHWLVRRFAPKNVAFPFVGVLCRLYLAAMHFNEDAERHKDRSSEVTAEPQQSEPKPKYVSELMKLLFEDVFKEPSTYVDELKRIPVPDDLRPV